MRTLLIMSLVVAWAGAASAQAPDAPAPRRRITATQPRAPDPIPPRTTAVPYASGRMTLGGLAGLRSPDDGGATCRSACARTRYACEAQEDACTAPWSACLKSCSDSQTPKMTALLPR